MRSVVEAQQETDHWRRSVAVELLAEQDRHRTSQPLDLTARRLDDEAAAARGADQQAGQALGLKEGRQVCRKLGSRGRDRLIVVWIIR